MTRTHFKHMRAYINGVDVSGYERSTAAMTQDFAVSPAAAMTDGVLNIIQGQATVSMPSYNGFLDNDAAGAFAQASASNGTKDIVIVIGQNAAPVAGAPVFAWRFEQSSYTAEAGEGFVAANILFGGASYASPLDYSTPWGVLLHPSGTETDVNSSTGVDDFGASTSKGGIFFYQLLDSDGTVTLKAQDAATNLDLSFSDITGATSGSIDASVSPAYGMVELSKTETIDRYIRWQLELGTATEATFICGIIRNHI